MSITKAATRKRKKSVDLLSELKPVPMPRAISPMLCTLVAEPFDKPNWIFETKLDGLRIIGFFDGNQISLASRNQKLQNVAFPDMAAALRESLSKPAIVDGEIVCLDEHGQSSFRSLQQRFHLENAREIRMRMKQHPAYLYLFDLLYLDRFDVSQLALRQRKELLRGAVEWSDQVRWTDFQAEEGKDLLKEICQRGGEGVVGKHIESRYVQGRSSWWVKIKCIGRQEFVIGGFTEPQRSRLGLGALLVGYYSDDGRRFIYAGKVGTGYTDKLLLELREMLALLKQRDSPFDEGDPPRGGQVHWVQPRLVAEIAFAEWTQNGLLRQPRFEGLKLDKKPKECHRERPAGATRE